MDTAGICACRPAGRLSNGVRGACSAEELSETPTGVGVRSGKTVAGRYSSITQFG